MDGLEGGEWPWWRGRCWASLGLLEVHSPCQIASMVRGKSRGGHRSGIHGGAGYFAKCLFY
jgi:hypothetical protein